MAEIELVTIITPAEGKVDRVEEMLQSVCDWVHTNEQDTLRYHLHKEVSGSEATPVFILLETFKNSEAHASHSRSPKFAELGKVVQEEGLFAKQLTMYPVKAIGGFKDRA